jgi:methionyl-tRNA formyltransferase
MKIIFFGSDDFALTSLENLVRSKFNIRACVTQPDKAKGRGMKVIPSSVKTYARGNNIPVLQPVKASDHVFLEELKKLNADLFVVVAYGQKLSKNLLNIPKIFAINLHGSYLPQYRGAAPINWAIMTGDKTTGVTIFKINEQMDAGEIISQEETVIEDHDNAITLRGKMAEQGAQLLTTTIQRIIKNEYQLTKQDFSKVTYAPKLTKELGIINWLEHAEHIHNVARGLLPWPGAYTYFQDKKVKILETAVIKQPEKVAQCGEVLAVDKKGIMVFTGQDLLLIKKVHPESKKEMDAQSFAVGHKLTVGCLLG